MTSDASCTGCPPLNYDSFRALDDSAMSRHSVVRSLVPQTVRERMYARHLVHTWPTSVAARKLRFCDRPCIVVRRRYDGGACAQCLCAPR